MMATTHVLVGLAIAATIGVFGPEIGLLAVIAAAVGGAFPDLDLYAGHRRTLHYPVYYTAVAVPTLLLAAVLNTPMVWAIGLFLAGAAAHSVMDAAGGGLELRPWRGNSDRAVYSHYHGRWLPPRRIVRYDGAPEDLVLGGLAALPGLLTFEGHLLTGLWILLGVSLAYTVVRKPMVAFAEWLLERTPKRVQNRLPERFLEDPLAGDTKP